MKTLLKASTAISAWLLPALTAVVIINVLVRMFSDQALSWPFEVSIFLFGISALLAGGQVLRENGHVAVDIIPRMIGRRGRTVLRAISLAVVVIVALFLIIQGSITAFESTLIRERSIFGTTFNPEIWWFRWMIPLGGLLLLLEALRQSLKLNEVVAEEIERDRDDNPIAHDLLHDESDEKGDDK